MDVDKVIDTRKYQIGVIVARYQIDKLHEGQKKMIDFVLSQHKKVILFLGVSSTQGDKRNPLDFATRATMIKKDYPTIQILPQVDQLLDEVWSKNLDNLIKLPFGEKKALLYGSRDSFIPHYKGKYDTTELVSTIEMSGSEVRENISNEILASSKFRAGIIHGAYARRDITFPTVDVCVYNDNGQILLARKPNEGLFRFVGGFVDTSDLDYEMAARREFSEETNGCAMTNLRYILSQKVNDWRYSRGSGDGIMTTLFLGRFSFGNALPTDDIAELKWVDISRLTRLSRIETEIEPVHQEMMIKLIEKIYKEELVPNLGKFYTEPKEFVDPDEVKPSKFKIK